MPLRAIFFDVGETLIDETRLYHGWADTMDVDRTRFMAVLDEVIAGNGSHRQVFERLRPGFDVAAAVAERKRTGTDFHIEQRDLYADSVACLSALAGDGWFVGIAGNQPRSAKAALAGFGLSSRLITTSAELGADKPAAEFFRRMLDMAGFDASEALYVGDRVDNDVRPARAYGMSTVLLERGPWGRNHARLPDADLADIRVKTLAELPEAIRHLRTA